MSNKYPSDPAMASKSPERGGRKCNTRLFVVSDLHLGGNPPMMGRQDWLESFIDGLPNRLVSDEVLELVIAGDFVDFLAIPPYSDFTSAPREAVDKLETVTRAQSPFAPVFNALGRHVARGHRLTVLVGNHDVELALPSVQEALLKRIEATPHDVLFVDDGRAYRVGRALIEHGNAYDGANANDWDGLRHIGSAQSRAMTPVKVLDVSPGSRLVNRIVNALKDRYPFVSLLQPEGELLVLLLLAFEPKLAADFGGIRQILHARNLAAAPPKPGAQLVAAWGTEKPTLDPELLAAFGKDYEILATPPGGEVGALGTWFRAWVTPDKNSLSNILKEGRSLPAKRIEQLRIAIRKLLRDDDSDRPDGPAEQYGEEAKRLLSSSAELDTVVMGHTHLPRCKRYGQGTYINSGTWIDRFRVPNATLADTTGVELAAFLKKLLVSGGVPPLPPTFADLSIDTTGRVTRSELATYKEAEQ